MSKVADILRQAADLIEPEGAWTRGAPARNAQKKSVDPWSDKAVCWCAAGALGRFTRFHGSLHCDAIWMLRMTIGGSPTEFNDFGHTQAEVVHVLRRAAARAEQVKA